MRWSTTIGVCVMLCVVVSAASAAEVDITHVRMQKAIRGWAVDVALQHDDVNERHFANWIEVETADGDRPARVIRRDIPEPTLPDDERPLYRIYLRDLPDGTTKLRFRGHCTVNSYGGREVVVELKNTEGEGYVIEKQPFNWRKYQYFAGEDDYLRVPRMRPFVHRRPPFSGDVGRVR